MGLEYLVITAVHDVLPDVPVSIIKDLIQLFPHTHDDAESCAELVLQNILENNNADLEKEENINLPGPHTHANAVITNMSPFHSIPSTSDGPEGLGNHNPISDMEVKSSSSGSSSPIEDVFYCARSSPQHSLNNVVAALHSCSKQNTSDSDDVKIVFEVPSSKPSVIAVASTSASISRNRAVSVAKTLTTNTLQPEPSTKNEEVERIVVPDRDVNDTFEYMDFHDVLPAQERLEDAQEMIITETVLSVLPDTPIEQIQGLIEPGGNYDPFTCAENIIQLLLEDNSEGADDNFPSDDTESNQVPARDFSEVANPRVNQKRKRTEDNFEQPDVEESVESLPDINECDMFECNCCYNEVLFDNMVQCADGHLFCMECLKKYTEESVYGQGRRTLTCMFDGCDELFPSSQLIRALPEKLRLKYEERIAEEVLNLANLENLSRCPFCNFQALLDEDQHIFVCPNPTCQKRSCRKCGTIWDEHDGLSCNQVEKETETKIRTDYEEKMANSRIRTCPSCKARFTKESGCNRITCRCGQQLCYICRKQIKGYDHFCQHVRNPGKPCEKCQMCFLWTDAEYDDELAISEIKKEALQAREQQGFQEKKEIGAPDDPETINKLKAGRVPQRAVYGFHHYHHHHHRQRRNREHGRHYNFYDVIDQVAAGALPLREDHPVNAHMAPAAHAMGFLPFRPQAIDFNRPPRAQIQYLGLPMRPPVFLPQAGEFPGEPINLAQPARAHFAPGPQVQRLQREIPNLDNGALRAAAAAPKVQQSSAQTSNILDDCQSLVKNMQEQVRNLMGTGEAGKVQEAQQQLRNIAQQANKLARQLNQKKIRNTPARQQKQQTVKSAPARQQPKQTAHVSVTLSAAPVNIPHWNTNVALSDPRLQGARVKVSQCKTNVALSEPRLQAARVNVTHWNNNVALSDRRLQAVQKLLNDLPPSASRSLQKALTAQKKGDISQSKAANLVSNTVQGLTLGPSTSGVNTTKTTSVPAACKPSAKMTLNGTHDQGFYLASTSSTNIQYSQKNLATTTRKPEAALGAAPPENSRVDLTTQYLSAPGTSNTVSFHPSYISNLRANAIPQNDTPDGAETKPGKSDTQEKSKKKHNS